MNKKQRINILNKVFSIQKKQAQINNNLTEESQEADLIFDKLWNEALNEEIDKLPIAD